MKIKRLIVGACGCWANILSHPGSIIFLYLFFVFFVSWFCKRSRSKGRIKFFLYDINTVSRIFYCRKFLILSSQMLNKWRVVHFLTHYFLKPAIYLPNLTPKMYLYNWKRFNNFCKVFCVGKVSFCCTVDCLLHGYKNS